MYSTGSWMRSPRRWQMVLISVGSVNSVSNISFTLPEFAAVCHRLIRDGEDDAAVFSIKAGDEAFGLDRADLLGWEIDDADDLLAEEGFLRVMDGDLGGRFADAQFAAEVDVQDVGGFAGFGKIMDIDDRADAEFDPFEVVPGDHVHV